MSKRDPLLEWALWSLRPDKPPVAQLTFVGLCVLFGSVCWALLPDGDLVGKVAATFLLASIPINVADFGLWYLLYRQESGDDR